MELTNEFEVPVPLAEAWKVLTDVETIAPCLPGAELKEVAGDEYRGVVKVKVGPITASYRGAARFEELDAVSYRAVLRAEGRETRGQGNASATITATLVEASESSSKVSVVTDLNVTGKVAQFSRGVLGDVSAKLLEQFAANLEATVLSSGADQRGGSEPTETPPAKGPAPRRRTRPEAPLPTASAGEESGETREDAEAVPPASEPGESEQAPSAAATEEPAPGPGPAKEPAVRRIESEPSEPVDLIGAAGPSLAKRLLPYASLAGALFLLRIVISALKRRKK